MKTKSKTTIGIAIISLVLNNIGLAQVDNTTNNPVIFQSQLYQQFTNIAFSAGWASFEVVDEQLQFQIFLDEYFDDICGGALFTDSRQATIQMGVGQPMIMSMCDPVLVPGSDPPIFITCDGLWAGIYYSGSIPLNETLLRELVAGQGEVFFYLPATWQTNSPYWDRPPPVQGRLLQMPGGDLEGALHGLPRTPRSLSAVVRTGPIFLYPFYSLPENGVDVDGDGNIDYELDGQSICTASIPSECNTSFSISCISNNQLLIHGYDVFVMPLGTLIGTVAPTNADWGNPVMGLLTSTHFGSCITPWSGELGRLGEGYLGVKLRCADGDHYGWIRIRLPKGKPNLDIQSYLPEIGPVIEDWAYEPTPDTPIFAGARPFVLPIASSGIRRTGYLRASFASEVGRAYAVQFKSDLMVRQWSNLGGLIISTATQTMLDLPLVGTAGFYRVVEAE